MLNIAPEHFKPDPEVLSPAVLAYVGDAVYELVTRQYLVGKMGRSGVNKLHREAVKRVRARAQAGVLEKLKGSLTEKEAEVVRRGRNAGSGHVPKNARVLEYRHSTGLECLVGYLYLKGNMQRLEEIMKLVLDAQE